MEELPCVRYLRHTEEDQFTAARPPTRTWEVARTVVAPPSSVVKCLWGGVRLGVWGLVLVVCVSRVLFSVGVCVCVCV